MVHQYCWEWEIKGTNVPEILFYKGFKKKKEICLQKGFSSHFGRALLRIDMG